MKTLILISILILSLLCAACGSSTKNVTDPTSVDPTADACRAGLAPCITPSPATDDMAQARGALEAFFTALNAGQYEKAAEIYGGSYEELIDMNPDINPNDHAALLERACTINGFQCLQIREVIQGVQDLSNTFTFTLEFSNPDGSLSVLNACCGATETEMPPQSRFEFRVERVPELGNAFLVQQLPVYVP